MQTALTFLDTSEVTESIQFWASHWGVYGYDSARAYVQSRGGVSSAAISLAADRTPSVESTGMLLAALTPVQGLLFRQTYLAALDCVHSSPVAHKRAEDFGAMLAFLAS